MPWTKQDGKWVTESGHKMTREQVIAYCAKKGKSTRFSGNRAECVDKKGVRRG